MKPAVRVCCAAATIGILMSGVAFAKTTDIGKAEVVVPDVKSTSVEQQERSLQVGTDVFKDDIVRTGNIGAAMLQFTDKTTLKIFPNSTVKLDNYVYDSEKTVLRIGLSLLSGAMRLASGGPHAADKYQLRTPQATIGIRGTVIHIVSDEERTVVEALHGTFHACATTGSACQTVSATDDMNALHMWSDGRLELARARRDLGVRSALGSSDASATPPVLLGPTVAPVGGLESRNQGGNDANRVILADSFQFLRLNRPVGSLSVFSTPTTSGVSSGQGKTATFSSSGRSFADPSAEFSAESGASRNNSGGTGPSSRSFNDSFFDSSAASGTSQSYSGGTASGGVPAPEVNAFLGLALAAGTVAFLRRKRDRSATA